MSFDLFVQSCIILKRMTDVFKRYDDDRDGYITLSFEEFLTGKDYIARNECKRYVLLEVLANKPGQKYYANAEPIGQA